MRRQPRMMKEPRDPRRMKEPREPRLVLYTAGVHTPVQTPLVYNPAVQTPLVYNTPLVNTVYNTALTTPLLSNVFPSLKTFTTPVVSHITKREAEADMRRARAMRRQPRMMKEPRDPRRMKEPREPRLV